MFALLISSLALVMLASMIASSTDMVRRSETYMREYTSAGNSMADRTGSVSTGTVSMSFGDSGTSSTQTFPVSYYVNEKNSQVVAYTP